MARTQFWVCVHCDLDLGDMTLGQGHDTPLGHGQQLWWNIIQIQLGSEELWPRHGFLVYVQWPWPWRYDLGPRSWHNLGSWTTIVWNNIQIRQGGTKLWPGHNVNRRTDRQGDSYIPPQTLFVGGIIIWEFVPIVTNNSLTLKKKKKVTWTQSKLYQNSAQCWQ